MTVDLSKMAAWEAMQAKNKPRELEPRLPLKGGGGGGTSDDMIPVKDYVDARDDAVESRLNSKLDTLATHKDVRNNVWGAVAVALAVVIGLIAFGGDRFDSGLSVGPAFQEAAMVQNAVDGRQDKSIADVNAKLDILIERTAPENANRTAKGLRGN